MNRKRRERVGKKIHDPKNIDQTFKMQGSTREKIGEEERFERQRHRILKHLQFIILGRGVRSYAQCSCYVLAKL